MTAAVREFCGTFGARQGDLTHDQVPRESRNHLAHFVVIPSQVVAGVLRKSVVLSAAQS